MVFSPRLIKQVSSTVSVNILIEEDLTPTVYDGHKIAYETNQKFLLQISVQDDTRENAVPTMPIEPGKD